MDDKHTTPHTEDTGKGPDEADKDVQSDPAEGGQSSEWADEGGATSAGPATDTD
ncbi:MAG: hypothetical protein WBQ44_02685 [Rhodococcus sp. (in: high G+C Gram-positive bacteria)]